MPRLNSDNPILDYAAAPVRWAIRWPALTLGALLVAAGLAALWNVYAVLFVGVALVGWGGAQAMRRRRA